MRPFKFRPATSARAKVRIAVEGASGSGKTLGALLLAHGLGEKIAVIDTETRVDIDHKNNEIIGVFGRSEQYVGWDGHPLKFDACPMLPPYSPERYMEALHEAYRAGYDVVIVDSLSHEWAGHGGILELVDEHPSRNKFDAWKTWTPAHRALLERIVRAPCHVICTLRTKTAYEVVDENGKKVPKKLGLAPVAREGTDYEFDVVFGVDSEDHHATVLKANAFYSRRLREELARERRLTVGLGRAIGAWADAGGFERKGAAPEAAPPTTTAPAAAPHAPEAAPAIAAAAPPPPPSPDEKLSLEDVLCRIGRGQTRHAEDALAAKATDTATVSSAILNLASRAHGKDLVGRLWEEVGGKFYSEGRSTRRRSLTGAQLRALIAKLPVRFPADAEKPSVVEQGFASPSAVQW